MHLMDVIIAYLYRSMDNDIYMKIPKGFKKTKSQKQRIWEYRRIKKN